MAHDDAPSLGGDISVEAALTGGTAQRVGWFRFYFDDERWEWSPEVARLHGYEPGTIQPTTRLVLSHKHPEDYEHVAARLEIGTHGFYVDVTSSAEDRETSINEAVAEFAENRALIEQVKGVLMC